MHRSNVKAVIARHVSKGLSAQQRPQFLGDLKRNPEKMIGWVRANLDDWAAIAVMDLCVVVIITDYQKDATDLIEYFKTHFANELVAIS